MPIIQASSLYDHQYHGPELDSKVTDSFITTAEQQYLIPVLTKQLYDDICENPSLYSNLIDKYISPCLIDFTRLLLYNQHLADNSTLSIPDKLRTDVIKDISASANYKLKQLADHLKTGIYHFYVDSSASSTLVSGFLKTKPPVLQNYPFAKVKIIIPVEGTTFETNWGDSAYFPNYIDSEWGYDFNAFLQSLGKFIISWGDGTQEAVPFYYQQYSHVYKTAGAFTVTIFSIYAFFNNSAVDSVVALSKLKNLNLSNSPNLFDPPNLSGLYLQVLSLFATGISTPPYLSGLIGLQYLDLHSTAITTPPHFVNLLNIKSLNFWGCTLLSRAPVLNNLINLEYLNLCNTAINQEGLDQILSCLSNHSYTKLATIDLRVAGDVAPSLPVVVAFQAAHPLADLYLNPYPVPQLVSATIDSGGDCVITFSNAIKANLDYSDGVSVFINGALEKYPIDICFLASPSKVLHCYLEELEPALLHTDTVTLSLAANTFYDIYDNLLLPVVNFPVANLSLL